MTSQQEQVKAVVRPANPMQPHAATRKFTSNSHKQLERHPNQSTAWPRMAQNTRLSETL